ncbi:MAG: HD-GYP domain-containing protein [Xanthobacteraceae bacterium]
MNRLLFVGSSEFAAGRLRRQVAGILDVDWIPVSNLEKSKPGPMILVDVNLHGSTSLVPLKEWLKSKPASGKVIFVVRPDSHLEVTQAFALGATEVVPRPIDTKALLKSLMSDVAALADKGPKFAEQGFVGVAAAQNGLEAVFASACLGEMLDGEAINSAGAAAASEIESKGFSSWIEVVRNHHSQTYQHCLLVTGTAIAFAQHLRLSRNDRSRLAVAGMLHDLGKARIPLSILEKPGPLDQEELAIMRRHPEYGLEVLKSSPSIEPAMIDMVVHHHEYLDGTGYPDGLEGQEISDLTRLITISDIFAALIEKRSYKPPLPNSKAYEILLDMDPKLDKDLVREFRFVTACS